MTDDRDPLEQRLRQALPPDVSSGTRERHLAAIDGALRPRPARLGWRHRIGTALAAAAAMFAPVGTAVAAEGAVPGELLYPVKQISERVQAWVRDEVVLEHRVEELDTLLERDASDDTLVTAVDRGIDAALDQPDEPELQERLAGLALEAARRVRDADRLALDRLPTRRPPSTDSPTDAPTRPAIDPDREPDVRPSPSENPTTSTDRPSPTSSPSSSSPTRSPSPLSDDGPSPTDSRTATDGPSPEPSPTRDERQPLRTERHEARDAGVVFIDVYRDGIRVAGVRVNDGWEHHLDRSHEPQASRVGFLRSERRVVLTARWGDDGRVHVIVEEQRTTDDTAATDTR